MNAQLDTTIRLATFRWLAASVLPSIDGGR